MASTTPKIVREEVQWHGRWLKMKHIYYTDPHQIERCWETLERTNHKHAEVDAVEIIPILRRKGKPNQLVVIRQFRPPVGGYVIELPAGLADANEPAAAAALRELHEETGYVGKVVETSPVLYFGMAISNTSSGIVTVEIDGDLPENNNPKPKLDEGEFADVILLPLDNLMDALKHYQEKESNLIDGKIFLLATALRNAKRYLTAEECKE